MKVIEEDRHNPGFRWAPLVLTVSLVSISALCLLSWAGWAAVYSGNYGLPSHASLVAVAEQRISLYFWAGVVSELALVVTNNQPTFQSRRLGTSASVLGSKYRSAVHSRLWPTWHGFLAESDRKVPVETAFPLSVVSQDRNQFRSKGPATPG
jgi:hypothetical protein